MDKKIKTKELKSFFHTISFKMIFTVAFLVTFLLIFYIIQITNSMNLIECNLIDSRLDADIKSLYDDLIDNDNGVWTLKEDGLYLNDILIGDGTFENANIEPFKHYENLTGTFCYVFARTYNDDELKWVDDGEYMQGHYIRVAGSTLGPKGERLEGTYIDKSIADKLEQDEENFYGKSNVNGREIYCHYELLKNENGENIGIISNGRSIEELKNIISGQKMHSVGVVTLITIFVALFLILLVKRVIKSIKKIDLRLKKIGTGNLNEEPLDLKTKDEFGNIAVSINEMTESLIERKHFEEELNEKKRDLEIAASIQSSMLPDRQTALDINYSIYAEMTPAKLVGGDFYDFFKINDYTLVMVMADVSGKGIQASLYMSFAKAVIKIYALEGNSTDKIAEKANNFLNSTKDMNMFVTAWIGIFDMKKGIFFFTNAGHNPPCIMKKGGNYEYLKCNPNFVLGAMPKIKYSEHQIKIMPGDKIFLYTDGVTEAKSKDGNFYTSDRLIDEINKTKDKNTKETVEYIKSSVDKYQADTEQYDDITLLSFEFKNYFEN